MIRLIVVVALVTLALPLQAQIGVPKTMVPPYEAKRVPLPVPDTLRDSTKYIVPNADSARVFDSLYTVRRKEILERMGKNSFIAREDFLSIMVGGSAFGRMRAKDLQRYFAIQSGRSDPEDDASNFSGVDRYFFFGGEAQFTSTWGVFTKYLYTSRYYNTLIKDSKDPMYPNGDVFLDLVSHTVLAGPVIIPFDTKFVRSKLLAGIGPAFVSVTEEQRAAGATREGSAVGFALGFEAEFDFRVVEQLSFGLSLYTLQVSAGKVTRNGNSLAAPFGTRTTTLDFDPSGAFIAGGLAMAIHYYF